MLVQCVSEPSLPSLSQGQSLEGTPPIRLGCASASVLYHQTCRRTILCVKSGEFMIFLTGNEVCSLQRTPTKIASQAHPSIVGAIPCGRPARVSTSAFGSTVCINRLIIPQHPTQWKSIPSIVQTEYTYQ